MQTPPSIYVVRHAHRDKKAGRQVDNGLSKKGLLQSYHLTRILERHLVGKKAKLLSSPKLRCKQTIQALGDIVGAELEIDPLLDEENNQENSSGLKKRIKAFQKFAVRCPKPLVICSHGDWIPLFLKLQCGFELPVAKGGIVAIHGEEIEWWLQKPSELF